MEYSNLFVCLMGIGTVFVGLICIIILISIMGAIIKRANKSAVEVDGTSSVQNAVQRTPAVQTTAGTVTPQMVAAVSAVLAEEMGTEPSGIRIVSFKKINS